MSRPASKSHASVYDKGAQAFREGKPRRAPYADTMCGRHLHIVTGARGYIRVWHEGWDDAQAGKHEPART